MGLACQNGRGVSGHKWQSNSAKNMLNEKIPPLRRTGVAGQCGQ